MTNSSQTLDAFLGLTAAADSLEGADTAAAQVGDGLPLPQSSASQPAEPVTAPLFPDLSDFGPDAGPSALSRSAGSALSPIRILVELALDRALGRPGRAHLRHPRSEVLLIRVPSAAWIVPVESTLFERQELVTVIAVSPGRRRDPDERVGDFTRALAAGRLVVGLSTDLDLLPSAMRIAADLSVTVEPVGRETVTRAIRTWCGGRAPDLAASDLLGLDLSDVAATFRPGSKASDIVRRLRRSSARRCGTSTGQDIPHVRALVGYGAAGDFAVELVEEVARFKTGKVDRLPSALFFGPPGTGKTSLAHAIARSANLPIIKTSVASWFTNGAGYLDSVLKQQNSFFDQISQQRCVAMIDELDSIPSRSLMSSNSSRSSEFWSPVVTNILLQVDKLRSSSPGTILLAATNHVERVDAALLRPGRLDYSFEIAPPDEAALGAIIRQHLGNDIPGADLARVARLGLGGTGADAAGWVAAARRRARARGRLLQVDDLMDAVAPPDPRRPEAVYAVALHEAGHAAVASRLGLSVERVSIRPVGTAAGCTDIRTNAPSPTLPVIAAQVVGVLAGRAADTCLGAGPDAGAVSDLRQATEFVTAARATFGLGGTLRHRGAHGDHVRILGLDADLADAVEADLKAALAEATRRVEADASAIRAIADALVRDQVLDGDAVRAILAAHPPSRPLHPYVS